eukprot:TRINITY_DN751_c0_g4_i1.p1 TRINITY_DN751_c0_g4~~TRINITY_DN751_c0_g4_i1.p1  ORF type:complete len:1320 (+),score=358.64 TRINITY_DN751_c0_g4_i1:89-4048(+)
MQTRTGTWNVTDKPLPLKNISIDGTITQNTARINYTQNYQTTKVGDLEFKFPLYSIGTVVGFQVTIGDQIINANTINKTDAEKLFFDATNDGFSQYYEAYYSTDIFICRIRRAPANTVVSLKISVVCELSYMGDQSFLLVLPSTLSPKELIERRVIIPQTFPFNMKLDVNMFSSISRVDSTSTINYEKSKDNLSSGVITSKTYVDGDISLLIVMEKPISDTLPQALLEQNPKGTDTALRLLLYPHSKPKEKSNNEDDENEKEIIFLIDAATIEPSQFKLVLAAFDTIFDTLLGKSGIYFNLVMNTKTCIAPLFEKNKSVPLDLKNLSTAKEKIHASGFEKMFNLKPIQSLEKALKSIYDFDVIAEDIPRYLFLVSNGSDPKPAAVKEFISSRDDFMIFPLSVGNCANHNTLLELAAITNGKYRATPKIGSISPADYTNYVMNAAKQQISRILNNVPTDITIDFGELKPLVQYSVPVNNKLYLNDDILSVNAFLKSPIPENKDYVISLKTKPSTQKHKITINSKNLVRSDGSIYYSAVLDRLKNLDEQIGHDDTNRSDALNKEAETLCLQNNMSSFYSSFWNKTVTKVDSAPETCQVILVSSTDFNDCEKVVRRYDRSFLLNFMPKFTEMPPGIDKSLLKDSKGEDKSSAAANSNKKSSKQKGQVRVKKVQINTAWETEMDNKAIEELYRTINSLLNKLTAEKFDKITAKIIMRGADVKGLPVLKNIVSMVYEKSLAAPHYAMLFANLSYHMQEKYPKFSTEVGEKKVEMDFRRILLDFCKNEFDSKNKQILAPEHMADDDKEEYALKKRLRKFGNITFIGELYKKTLLSPQIIHAVITGMLELHSGNVPESQEIELTCKLLTTIGQHLDQVSADSFKRNDAYFAKMVSLSVNTDKVPSRIRCLLMDLLELRQRNWLSRKGLPAPIPKVKEPASETRQQQLDKAKEELRREREQLNKSPVSGIPRSASANRIGSPLTKSAGWAPTGRGTTNPKSSPAAAPGVSLSASEGVPKPWASPSSPVFVPQVKLEVTAGTTSLPTLPVVDAKPATPEKWTPKFRRVESSSDVTTTSSSSSGTPQGSPVKMRLSQSTGSIPNLANHSHSNSAPPIDEDDDDDDDDDEDYNTTKNQSNQPVDDEKAEKKIKELLEEYLDAEDIETAAECVKEIMHPNVSVLTIRRIVKLSINGKERDKKLFMSLLSGLFHEFKILQKSDFTQGFKRVMEEIEDIVLDLPFAYRPYAQMLSFTVTSNLIEESELKQIFEVETETDIKGKVLLELFVSLSKEKDVSSLSSIAQSINAKVIFTPAQLKSFQENGDLASINL